MKIKTNPSAKEIYFWNLLGNLAASGVSVLYLLIVTRLTPLGLFGLLSDFSKSEIIKERM